MDAQISRLQIRPEDILMIKNELIQFFLEFVWKRVELGKVKTDFHAKGLLVCSDGEKEMSIPFNDFSGEGSSSDLDLTTRQLFHTLKYGPKKRFVVHHCALLEIETRLRRRLEKFFQTKLMIFDFDFNACGLIMLSDGLNEIHLRMKNIRTMMRNELIVLNNDVEDIITVELPSGAEEPFYISSGEEDSTENTSSNNGAHYQRPKLVFADKEEESNSNQPGMNQNDVLNLYINIFQKQIDSSKAVLNQKKIGRNSLHEASNINVALNLSLNNIRSPENGRGIKRESISKENVDRPKKTRLSHEGFLNDNIIYTCKLCNETVTGRQKYLQHSKDTHSKVPCYICGNTFTQKGNMERHMNSHLGKKLFNCDVCDSSYTRLESLQSHKAKHHQ